MPENIVDLTAEQITQLEEMKYVVGDGYKTHSSTFYPLIKNGINYLLKIDQTNSGSLPHQYLLSKVQKTLKIPSIESVFLGTHYDFIIMEKLENAVKFHRNLSTQLLKEFGRQMRLIHNQKSVLTKLGKLNIMSLQM